MVLHVRMEQDELEFFSAFLAKAEIYAEFGCGGSTVLAASLVRQRVVSVDSSKPWLKLVAENCAEAGARFQPELLFADIGPTAEWGYPVDKAYREQWPGYARALWRRPGIEAADLFLVDGRFRVACFLETLKRCHADAVILIHDFASRPFYHVVRRFAREIGAVSDLSAFSPDPACSPAELEAVLAAHRYTPD